MRTKIADFLNNQKADIFLHKKYDAKFFKALAEEFGLESYPLETWQEVLKGFKQMLAERTMR